jgi:hypothetical protein
VYYEYAAYDQLKTIIIAVFVVYAIATGAFSAWLASAKDREAGTWFFLGLLFGIIALIAIGLSPDEKAPEDSKSASPPPVPEAGPLTSEYLERMKRAESAGKTNPVPAAKHGMNYGHMTDNELDEALGASQAEELRKIKKLLDSGALTQEEFDKKKAQILGL